MMVDQSRRKVGWAQSGQGCQFPLQLGNARFQQADFFHQQLACAPDQVRHGGAGVSQHPADGFDAGARCGGDGNAKLPAGFHDDQGNIAIDEPALELGAGEPMGFHHAPGRVGHGQLEDGLWKTRTLIWRKKQGESIPSLNRTAHSRLCRLWASSQRQR